MINPKALETFGNYDKKSLMAGITVGQGLKGRARAAQTPAPAGFPQDLWDAASQRANAMIARLRAEESGETPSEPETPEDWTFDKDAFCFGVAAGRSLEGWEIDGFGDTANLEIPDIPDIPYLPDGWPLIMYYVHIENPGSVHINTPFVEETDEGIICADYGDGSPFTFSRYGVPYHKFQAGDYVITLISNVPIYPGNSYIGIRYGGVYGSFADGDSWEILRSAYLIGDVPYIGEFSFRGCSALESVTIPDSVTSIGETAFDGCSALESVTIPDSVTSIGRLAFEDCSALKSVTIPDGVTKINQGTFEGCSALESVTIPDSVTSIGEAAFDGCSALESVTIPNGVTLIDRWTFEYCRSLTSVSIPDGVTEILRFAFNGCSSLTNVTIPDSVTSIRYMAFYGCSSLTSVTIPESVTNFESEAFYGTGLTSVTINRNAKYGWHPFPLGCTINYY